MKASATWFDRYRWLPIAIAFVGGISLGTAQSFAGKTKDDSATTTGDDSAVATGRMGKTVLSMYPQLAVKRRRQSE